MANLSPPPSPPIIQNHKYPIMGHLSIEKNVSPLMEKSQFAATFAHKWNTRGLLFFKCFLETFYEMEIKKSFSDISILYNPLLYSNPFFWSPLFLPYAHGQTQSPPKSPQTRGYTLTPERDDQNGKD